MTILEALVQLRDDIKTWCINNFNNTKQSIDTVQLNLETMAGDLQNGDFVVSDAERARLAIRDGSGNVITSTYETKAAATIKLIEAKTYTDTAVAAINSVPTATTSNNGQFLRVVNGVPTWVTVDDGDGVSY